MGAGNDSGRDEIYVVPFPGPGGKTQVSADGGTAPRCSRSGRELFYRNGDKMMAVEVKPTRYSALAMPNSSLKRLALATT